MISTLLVFVVGVLLIGAAAFWTLRAYRDAGGRRMRGSMMACVAVALVGLGIYLLIGRPEIPDQAYAERLEALRHRDPTTFTPDEALAVLGEAARENPRDPLPHFYSGQVLLAQGRAAEAARAYDAALRREPRLAEALMGLGRAMVRIDEGRVSPETIAVFQQAAALTEDPAPWIYQAMGAMEAGQGAEARRLWGEALARMDEDDPRRDMARRMSREAGR